MIRVNLFPPSRPQQSKPSVATNAVKVAQGEKGRRITLLRFCIISFFLGTAFTFALAGTRFTPSFRAVVVCGAAALFALQLFIAKRADRTIRIPRPVSSLPKEDADAFQACLTKAGFSKPPYVSSKEPVYVKEYWGTVYVYEHGNWEHQVAFADKTLTFSGYGAETLETHLQSLEKTGRPTFPKDAQGRSAAEKVAKERSAARGDDGPIAIANLANSILAMAMKRGATHIHIEPQEKDVAIRFRIDGNLQEAQVYPKEIQVALISCFKRLAKIKTNEDRQPQEGCIRARVENRPIDFLVSTVPTTYGEKMVVQIHEATERSAAEKELFDWTSADVDSFFESF